jgi:hypothetical protein
MLAEFARWNVPRFWYFLRAQKTSFRFSQLPNSPDLNRFSAFTVLQAALIGKPDLEVSTG